MKRSYWLVFISLLYLPNSQAFFLDTPELLPEELQFKGLTLSPTPAYKAKLDPRLINPSSSHSRLWLYPLFSSSSPTPSPSPRSGQYSLGKDSYAMDKDWEEEQTFMTLTSSVANLKLTNAPMTIDFQSLATQFSALSLHQEEPPPSLPSLPLEGASPFQGQVISLSHIQVNYPNIYNLIEYIQTNKSNLHGFYEGSSQFFELSDNVLLILDEFLGNQLSLGQSMKQLEFHFRRLFSTLNINLFWRLTDHDLIRKLLRIYFSNSTAMYQLLLQLTNLVELIQHEGSLEVATQLQVYGLLLIANNFEESHIQLLLANEQYTLVFLAILLQDIHIMNRLQNRGLLNDSYFGARRTGYPHLFANVEQYLRNNFALTPEQATTFMNHLISLIRRNPNSLLCNSPGLGDRERLYCQPAETNTLLHHLNTAVGNNPIHAAAALQLLTTPLFLQGLAILINHIAPNHDRHVYGVVAQTLVTLDTGSAPPDSPELWLLSTVANELHLYSQGANQELFTILQSMGVQHSYAAAILLENLIQTHDPQVMRFCTEAKIRVFLKDLIMGKYQKPR